MRKEIFVATIAGIVVGLVIAFGVWRANSALKINLPSDTTGLATSDTSTAPTAKAAKKGELTLTLSGNINDYDVITESPLKITGMTKPEIIVVISAEGEDYITKSAPSGVFEQDIDLVSGYNKINITAFDLQGNSTEQKLNLVYSTEFAKDISSN